MFVSWYLYEVSLQSNTLLFLECGCFLSMFAENHFSGTSSWPLRIISALISSQCKCMWQMYLANVSRHLQTGDKQKRWIFSWNINGLYDSRHFFGLFSSNLRFTNEWRERSSVETTQQTQVANSFSNFLWLSSRFIVSSEILSLSLSLSLMKSRWCLVITRK